MFSLYDLADIKKRSKLKRRFNRDLVVSVSATGNFLLHNYETDTYSVYYGQSYEKYTEENAESQRDHNFVSSRFETSERWNIRQLSDIGNDCPLDTNISVFKELFNRELPDTKTEVVNLLSKVYIISFLFAKGMPRRFKSKKGRLVRADEVLDGVIEQATDIEALHHGLDMHGDH